MAEQQRRLDIGPLLDGGNWTSYGMVTMALASLAFLVDGLATQVVALSIPAIMRDWQVTREAFSNVIAGGYLGIAIGTVLVGALADRWGRRVMLLVSIMVFTLATAAISQIHDVPTLIALRFIDGLGLGGCIPTATSLIAEYAPLRRRNRAVNLGMITISIGNMSCGLLAAAILPAYGWRAMFLIISALSLLAFVVLLFLLPESPRFLVQDPARHDRLRLILTRLQVNAPADTEFVDSRKSSKGRTSLAELFGSGRLLSTLGLWGAFFFSFMTAYTSLSWIPTLLAGHGFNLGVTSTTLSSYSLGGILGSLLCARLVEVLGSRITMAVLAAIGVGIAVNLAFLPLDPNASVMPLVASFTCLGLCIGGLTGCLYSVAAYTYPPAVKATGIGAASGVGRIGAILSSYVAVAAISMGGSRAFFLLVGTSALFLLAFVLLVRTHIPRDKAAASPVRESA